MKYLITGGAGFIGSNFIRYILKTHDNADVFNIDKLAYGKNFNSISGFKHPHYYDLQKKDIANLDDVCTLLQENKIDTVVHFAASTHVDTSINMMVGSFEENKYGTFKRRMDSGDFILNNVYGTEMLLDAMIRTGVKRIHHISTDEVFGELPLNSKERFTESSPYNPSSPYSASKAAADHLVRAYQRTLRGKYDLKVTISNCSNNYGPYQHIEKLIPKVITHAIQDKKIPVYGEGINVRDWIHVDDHNKAIDLILNKGEIGETYLVGANSEKTNIEVVKTILKVLGKPESLIEYVKDRPGHDLRYAIDSSKLQRLGWKAERSFEEGIIKTVNWYKEHESWWRKLQNSK